MQALKLFALLAILLTSTASFGQSYAWGIKGGLTVGIQNWENSFDRSALFRYHGIAFIETASEDDRFGLFAQAGYHVKGSAIRTAGYTTVDNNGNQRSFRGLNTPFEFYNVSLTLGAKQKYGFGPGDSRLYYLLGIRADYTIGTNFDNFNFEDNVFFATIYPIEGFVNKFNYGASVGGGIEFPLSELIGVFLEFTVNPDFSKQYNQPQINNVINPYRTINGGPSTITIRERSITNVTFELSLGFRFLNIIEYID